MKMNTVWSTIRGSKLGGFAASFSPATRAAAILALPFALVDAVHYYTAGTALVVSLPLLGLFYLACGALAARFAAGAGAPARGGGFRAGVTLWAFSTFLNTLVGLVAGALSLGVTALLGIPYLLLCGPAHALLGGLAGLAGASIYRSIRRRLG